MADKVTAPDRIRAWVEREFNPKYVERVFQELLDVATGTTYGNRFCHEALARIFPELEANWRTIGEGPWDTQEDALDFAEAEVGITWRVRKIGRKWVVQVTKEYDDVEA